MHAWEDSKMINRGVITNWLSSINEGFWDMIFMWHFTNFSSKNPLNLSINCIWNVLHSFKPGFHVLLTLLILFLLVLSWNVKDLLHTQSLLDVYGVSIGLVNKHCYLMNKIFCLNNYAYTFFYCKCWNCWCSQLNPYLQHNTNIICYNIYPTCCQFWLSFCVLGMSKLCVEIYVRNLRSRIWKYHSCVLAALVCGTRILKHVPTIVSSTKILKV